ncbi:MAG: hypothetical protein ACKVI3_14150 [Verrucomicrobiia bacterium]|tara:strand:- start:11730 stop:12050 length:321 start_codon:yes stop_codon:yes gene_type:complete
MSNSSSAPQPVLWPLIVAVMGVFAIFLVIVNLARTPVTPITAAVNVPEEEQWKLSSTTRQERRAELEGEAKSAATSYGWINQNDGIVRLPVERAIELTLADINADR